MHANLGLQAPIPLGLFGARLCDVCNVCDPQRCGWFEGAAARRTVLRWEYHAPSVALLLPFELPSCAKFFEIQHQRPMTKAIIFDLDSCLAAADEVGEQLFAPAFAARGSDRRLESAQHAEEIADVRDDGLRFFPGRDVSAAGVIPLLLEVVVALGPAARGAAYFLRQHRNADWSLDHGHAIVHRRPGIVCSLVVVAPDVP